MRAKVKLQIIPEPIARLEIKAPEKIFVGKIYKLEVFVIGKSGYRLSGHRVDWKAHGNVTISQQGELRAEKVGRMKVIALLDHQMLLEKL